MNWETFTPVSALFGGALIGIAASILYALSGRVAGISGMLGGVLVPRPGETGWRIVFLAALLVGGAATAMVMPGAFAPSPRGLTLVAVAGLLVGVGTRLGNGCTSGHGVCGISRLSVRSLVATGTFMATGLLAATAVRLLGGAE
jgi:uncharacterized membrane protein YedE/YeeE